MTPYIYATTCIHNTTHLVGHHTHGGVGQVQTNKLSLVHNHGVIRSGP